MRSLFLLNGIVVVPDTHVLIERIIAVSVDDSIIFVERHRYRFVKDNLISVE